MSNTLPPHILLSKLKENELSRLTSQLSILNANRSTLRSGLEKIEAEMNDIKKQQQASLADGVSAATLKGLEAGWQSHSNSKKVTIAELAGLDEEEKGLKTEIFNCMNKIKIYSRQKETKELEQRRQSTHAEQQEIDDLMAHRCKQGTQW